MQRIAESLHVPMNELTGQPFTPQSRDDVLARAAVTDLRDIQHGLDLGDNVEVPIRPLPELERATWKVRQLAIASDFGGYGPLLLLPMMLELHALTASGSRERETALRLLLSVAHASLWLAQPLGNEDLAMLAAGRAAAAANEWADPAAVGFAQWLTCASPPA